MSEFPAWDRDRYEKPTDDPAVIAYLRAKDADYDARNPQGPRGTCPFCSKRLLTIPEACAYLGMSTGKGYELLHAGKFPVGPRRIGSQWRVSKPELDEWLRNPP